MNKDTGVHDSHLSTFALTSVAKDVIVIATVAALQSTIQELRTSGIPFVIIGGGSNSLLAPYVDKVVLLIDIPGITYEQTDTSMIVTVGAGVVWDELVADTVRQGYSGLEALSAIPGKVGAAPIQNIGAYGTEVSEHIQMVQVYDIIENIFTSFTADQCGFSYRNSNFKTIWHDHDIPRYIVTAVTFRLSTGPSKQINYPGVAAFLPTDQPITSQMVRDAITTIRWSKLPRPEVLPNLGSFFHNPIIQTTVAESLLKTYPAMPTYATDQQDMRKVSAGWLIEQCGWKGKCLGPVGMYEKNALVMVNYGRATLTDVLALQQAVQNDVQQKFGITLVREPVIIE